MVYSQCNIYEAGQKKKTFEYYVEKAADKEAARSGVIRSEGDLFLNGAQAPSLAATGEECTTFHPSEYYPAWTLEPASDSLKAIVQLCVGWQSIPLPADVMVSCLSESCGKIVTKNNVLSRLKTWEKHYDLLSPLLLKSGAPFSWDYSRNRIQVHEESVWIDHVKANPSLAPYRKKIEVENWDVLCCIFSQDHV